MSYRWLVKAGLVLLLVVLTGCSASHSNYTGALGTLKLALFGTPDYQPTLAEIEASPYASQVMRMNGGPQGLTILSGIFATEKGRELRWTSADGVSVMTRHGRVVKIANWKELEISAYRARQPDPLPLMHKQKSAWFEYELDYMPGYRDGVVFQSELKQQGMQRHDILGQARELLHVVEAIESKTLNFRAINHYWLDPASGHVVKSLQFPLPQITKGIEITEAKPFGGRL